MKRLIAVSWIILIISIACESDRKYLIQIPDGVYVGTFQRQQAFGGGEVAQVTITFTSNTWTGQGNIPKYPALCHGTYTIGKQKINFTNECFWTAEFDASLILGGDYDLSLNGNQLEIIRSFLGPASDTWADKYILTKQK
jgi:hypothetical protein